MTRTYLDRIDGDRQLELLNIEYDKVHAAYRKASDITGRATDREDPVVASYELAEGHAVRQMQQLRQLASFVVPETIYGFALKARMFTDTEPAEWLNTPDDNLLAALFGQLLSVAGLLPISHLDDGAAQEIIAEIEAGKPHYATRDEVAASRKAKATCEIVRSAA